MAVSGYLISEAKDAHEYKAPILGELLENAKRLRSGYTGKNSSRLELISLLEIIHEFIEKLILIKKIPESELQTICLGCWIFCLESIAHDYKVLNPEFEIGSVFNTGSKLYQLMLEQLHIGNNNQINQQIKLEYLNKFYKFSYKEDTTPLVEGSSFIEVLRSKRLRIDLKESLIQVMQNVLGRENLEKRVLKAIPCENAMDKKIMLLQKEYKQLAKKQNPSRLFLIYLAMAVCKKNLPEDDPKKIIGHYIPRSQRIKMGCILFIMQTIAETYKFHFLRSPKDHSILYSLCDQILVNSFKNLDDTTKLACFSAFSSYMNDFTHRKSLEENMINLFLEGEGGVRCIYIDSEIDFISNDLNRMMKKLKYRLPSNITLTMTGLGALIGAAPGYGVGYGIGYGLSLTDQTNQYKQKFSGLTNYAMSVLFDQGGNYFGYYTADIVVNATLERFYAKLFEAFGALICAAGFGTMSFIIYDLSYETACNLCHLYLHLSKNVNPSLLSQTDLKFVNILLDLPENVFSDIKKEKLRNIVNISAKTSALGLLSMPATDVLQFEIIPMIKPQK